MANGIRRALTRIPALPPGIYVTMWESTSSLKLSSPTCKMGRQRHQDARQMAGGRHAVSSILTAPPTQAIPRHTCQLPEPGPRGANFSAGHSNHHSSQDSCTPLQASAPLSRQTLPASILAKGHHSPLPSLGRTSSSLLGGPSAQCSQLGYPHLTAGLGGPLLWGQAG